MDIDPVTEVQRCFALIRPAGMTDKAAKDWLTAAVAEVHHLEPRTLRAACMEARTKCTHHGQIVPTILASEAVADERKFLALKNGMDCQRLPYRGGAKQIGQVHKLEDYRAQ